MTEAVLVRREIKSRGSWWAPVTARWLKDRGVRPNQVSVASVGFATMCPVFVVLGAHTSEARWIVASTLLALAMILARLLCNLFDGMIAVEGGLRTKSGEIFNEVPDRLSDTVMLVGIAYAITCVGWAEAVGWGAACAALLTAYVRVLGGSLGLKQRFTGPMAKQHRMAVLAAALLLGAVERLLHHTDYTLLAALLLVAAGSVVTSALRLLSIVRELESRP